MYLTQSPKQYAIDGNPSSKYASNLERRVGEGTYNSQSRTSEIRERNSELYGTSASKAREAYRKYKPEDEALVNQQPVSYEFVSSRESMWKV